MKKRAAFNLILLGDPASGKATQAVRAAKRYHLYDFDMGRELEKPSVRARFDYANTKAKGRLAPTRTVRSIIRRVIPRVPPGRGILFDGHPKMIGEARLVVRLLAAAKRNDPFVIYLSIPPAEIAKRARKRARDDDAPEDLLRREQYYRENVSNVVAFFKKRYAFKELSGLGTPAAVWKRIERAITTYHASQNS